MNEATITKEELQWQTVDHWIQEGLIFTDLHMEEHRNKRPTLPHWTYEYDWKKDTKIYQWAKEILESEEKLVADAYPEDYEITVISGDIQKTYIIKKIAVEKK